MKRILLGLALAMVLLLPMAAPAVSAPSTVSAPTAVVHTPPSSTTLAVCQFISPFPPNGFSEIAWMTWHTEWGVHISKCAYSDDITHVRTCAYLVWETSVFDYYPPVSPFAPWCW